MSEERIYGVFEDGKTRACVWCGDLTGEFYGSRKPGKRKPFVWVWRDACCHDREACQSRRFEKRRAERVACSA